MTTTAISPVQPAPDDRAERFVQRVAGLSPAEWGRLDAAADMMMAGDPITRWRRARWRAAMTASSPFELLAIPVLLMADLGRDVAGMGEAELGRRLLRNLPGPGAGDVPGERRVLEQIHRLVAIAMEQPGASSRTLELLLQAIVSIGLEGVYSERVRRRMYAPVEAVIPYSTL